MRDYEYYSRVEAKAVEWLWYPYIPYGKITLLQGDPGEGKSTFMIQLLAILTRGGVLPDGMQLKHKGTVIYQCCEDGRADTIKPRLIAAGADCDHVVFIKDAEEAVTLDDVRLERTIKDTGAKLLILDPIQAFIPADTDMQSATKMRAVLRCLSIIAEKNGCAVVLVGHMNKSSGGKNIYRGLGSIDIPAVARSVLMIEREETDQQIRYMFPVKSSLAPEGGAIGFMMNPEYGFQWIGKYTPEKKQIELEVEEELPRAKKKELAIRHLKMILAEQDLPSVEVYRRMEQLDLCAKTVQTAGKEAGVVVYRKSGAWYWSLKEDSRG